MADDVMEEPAGSHMREVKSVKNDMKKKSTSTPPAMKNSRKISLFPIPHDHLDDIFLSSGGIE